ncbi:MAG TPA: SBBP repeat-containing protein [Blastocatellia bacterium]|nr:SBBP repeat-containing protein [Blastocatellia bacterium]
MATLPLSKTFAVTSAALVVAHLLAPAFLSRVPLATPSRDESIGRNAQPLNGTNEATKGRMVETLSKLPLRFEENQASQRAGLKFIARGTGVDFGIMPTAVVTRLHSVKQSPKTARIEGMTNENHESSSVEPCRRRALLRMQLVGGNRCGRVIGEGRLATRSNYFIGNDPRRWRTDVRNYERVRVEQVYRGIDVIYYGSGKQLEYDFKVAPGASFRSIALRFAGARRLCLRKSGELVIATAAGEIRQHKPVAYQVIDNTQREIEAGYVIIGKHKVAFAIGGYDKRLPLTIDPVLSFSTFFGGDGTDFINAIAVDGLGNAYVAGSTASRDLTITPGAFQSTAHTRPGISGFVAKFDLANTQLVYSTYLGGGLTGGDTTSCSAIAVDAAGNAFITGGTAAADFPTTPGAFQQRLAGGLDAFVTKLNATGTALVYSTYLGSSKAPVFNYLGADEGLGIAIDAAGNAYVTGRTSGSDFPVTAGALKTSHDRDFTFVGEVDPAPVNLTDAFITKLNPAGTALIYSTYFGGGGDDSGKGIKVDVAGNAFVVGTTQAANFPLANPLQASLSGGSDAFVAKLNKDGKLVYSTYVGGSGDDSGNAIDIDESGNAYFAGTTASTDLPTTAAVFQPASGDVHIYKSTDGGASWMPAHVGVPSDRTVVQVAVDPSNSANLYAGTFQWVFSSTDGGRHWRRTSDSLPIESFTVLGFDPKKPSTVYGMRRSGFAPALLLRSFDGGRTWETLNPPFMRSIFGIVVDPANTSTLYVTTDQGLFKTTDGVNWMASGKGLPNQGSYATILAINPRSPNRLFAYAGKLFVSSNGGKSWDSTSLGDTTIFNVAFDPLTPSTVYASGAGLFKSTDDGESWQEIDNDLPTFGVGKLVIDPSNSSKIYTTTRGGVFKSLDGGHHWEAINAGLGSDFLGLGGAFVSVTIDTSHPSTVYAWGQSAGTDAFVGKLDPTGSNLLYLSYSGGSGADSATGIAVDSAGSAYVTGQSQSDDFPVNRAFQPDRLLSATNSFVIKLSPSGGSLSYSTYVGGSVQDSSSAMAVDRFGSAYVVGYTLSPDFPLNNALQSSFRVWEAFLIQITDTNPIHPSSTISGISPSAGSSGGQYSATVFGANFLPGVRVRIGGVPMTISSVTSTAITGIVHGRSPGVVDVAVINPDGQSAVLKSGFTFLLFPKIDVVTIGGKELEVFGGEFDKGAVIIVGGSPQKTREDISGGITNSFLLSKKAARRIAPGQTVLVQVRNANGLVSAPVSYTRPTS